MIFDDQRSGGHRGASGVGAAPTRALASRGAKVAMFYIRKEKGQASRQRER
jgi:hypothetical protein